MKIIEKLKKLNADQTQLLLEVSYGNNYARKIWKERGEQENPETIVRQLNTLAKNSWLKKENEKQKIKNKKIYSINWDYIIESFIEYLIERIKIEVINTLKIWHSQDFIIEKTLEGYVKKNKTQEIKKQEEKKIEEIKKCLKTIKNLKKSERQILKSFFEKEVFILTYEQPLIVKGRYILGIKMQNLFDEVILGIGKSLVLNEAIKIKGKPLILTLSFLCIYIYKSEQIALHNTIADVFGNKFLKNKPEQIFKKDNVFNLIY